VVERADNGQLLAAWVTAEARVRRLVVGDAPFVLVGDSLSPEGAPTEEPQLRHPAPSSSVAPAVSDWIAGGTTPSCRILHVIDANVERHQAAPPTPPSAVRCRRWYRATPEHLPLVASTR
jgi:hypothetical protein